MSPSEGGKSTPIVAVDTGGTFTDLLLLLDGELHRLKLPSTPGDPATAVLDGVARLQGREGGERPTLDLLVHGSTVATNALLEGRGAPVALVTTRGFEDVIEIGRQDRPQLYALVGRRPPPPVPAELRFGIRGRMSHRGVEEEALDPAELAELARRIPADLPVAVCLLHSYAAPEHEEAVGRALASSHALVSLSSRLLPEYREYERTSTTVVNAAVRPVMSGYLQRLRDRSPARTLRIMGSSGIGLPVDRAMEEPVHTVLSGPAGGVVGARYWADRSEMTDILSFDMGGTSTDVALSPGTLIHTREFQIAGRPLAVPVLDIHTVGAGGGSLARVDPGGALRVGPESAGASPGPIAYRRGGSRVTVTDAHVWLGRVPSDAFLQDEGGLDRDGIRAPMESLARELGSTPEEAAEGVVSVADATMERALRVISVERGFDPRDFALVSFGGAGGLHAAELAGRLSVPRVLIPPDPGLLSAFGMLVAPPAREASRTVLLDSQDAEIEQQIDRIYETLEEECRAEMLDRGWDPTELSTTRRLDARYRGQSYELSVPHRDWRSAFHRRHRDRYGYAREDAPVEVVTLRVRVAAPPREPVVAPLPAVSNPEPERVSEVSVYHRGTPTPSLRIARGTLRPGHRFPGPALITEYSATTWVPPRWLLEVMPWGSLHLTFEG